MQKFITMMLAVACAVPAFGITSDQLHLDVIDRTSIYWKRSIDSVGKFSLDLRNGVLAPGVSIGGRAFVRYATDGTVRFTLGEPSDRGLYQPMAGFQEIYLDVASSSVLGFASLPGQGRFRIGKQLNLWGATDRVRPTDLLAPYDWTDLMFDERLGQWGGTADWKFDRGRYTLEGVWLPFFAPDRFGATGAWQLIPDGITIRRELPRNSNLDASGQYGLRGCYNGSTEVCVVGYRGRDHLPTVTPESLTSLVLRYPYLTALGGDVQQPIGDFMFRLEGAYRHYDGDVKGYAEIVTAIERIWFGMDRWGSNLFTLVQYVQQVPKRTDPFFVHSVFSEGILGRLRYGDDEGWYGQVEGGSNIDPTAYTVEGMLSGPLSGGLRFELRASTIGGSERHLFGARFEGNGRIVVGLTYHR